MGLAPASPFNLCSLLPSNAKILALFCAAPQLICGVPLTCIAGPSKSSQTFWTTHPGHRSLLLKTKEKSANDRGRAPFRPAFHREYELDSRSRCCAFPTSFRAHLSLATGDCCLSKTVHQAPGSPHLPIAGTK